MEKKIYTAPALSMEEFEMNEVISTSGGDQPFKSFRNNAGIDFGGAGDGSNQRAKNRGGIWEED